MARPKYPSALPKQQAHLAPQPAAKGKSQKASQPATKHVSRNAPTGPYSLRAGMKGNSNYKGFVKSVQPAGYNQSVGTKQLPGTLFTTVVCCLITVGSVNVLEAGDVLTFPEFGAVGKNAGR
jgi:hypothetical protein